MYAEFESAARAQISSPNNANTELILYYSDYAHQPQEALRIARIQLLNRTDVWTLDAYAWALYGNGQRAEACRQIEKALDMGTRDAQIYYHAGLIAEAIGKRDVASEYLHQSIELNPTSEASEAARRAVTQVQVSGT